MGQGSAGSGRTSGLCHACGAATEVVERVGRRDTCPSCGADLHCCCNCRFHDPQRHNQCREPQAERQVAKEAANFCEYFSFREAGPAPQESGAAARERLEALFRRGAK